jgi:hypothetical protein
MRRAAFLLPLALTSCAVRHDGLKPRIVITEPSGGGAATSSRFTVRGYVLDETGVRSLSVQGTAVRLAGATKIEPFAFQTLVTGSSADYTLRATDTSGNVTTLTLPVRVDTAKPTLTITSFVREGKRIRISGRAADNIQVAQVLVDGTRLNITPGRSVDFYAETSGVWADVEVRDSAGNVVTRRAQN